VARGFPPHMPGGRGSGCLVGDRLRPERRGYTDSPSATRTRVEEGRSDAAESKKERRSRDGRRAGTPTKPWSRCDSSAVPIRRVGR
jgi:hypothetical protein